ncbi:hypothetical protein BDW22DRAFT_122676 [Trametopsis cervina]|nr:hypothetical protein BDW22DRAFT_122676 [Trametopsis cervina]
MRTLLLCVGRTAAMRVRKGQRRPQRATRHNAIVCNVYVCCCGAHGVVRASGFWAGWMIHGRLVARLSLEFCVQSSVFCCGLMLKCVEGRGRTVLLGDMTDVRRTTRSRLVRCAAYSPPAHAAIIHCFNTRASPSTQAGAIARRRALPTAKKKLTKTRRNTRTARSAVFPKSFQSSPASCDMTLLAGPLRPSQAVNRMACAANVCVCAFEH